MPEYKCIWWPCPTADNVSQVNFVEAPDPTTAQEILEDYIQRKRGIAWFMVTSVKEYTRPTGGQVNE